MSDEPSLSKEEIPKDIKYKKIPKDIKVGRKELFCPLCGEANVWINIDRKTKKCPNCSLSTEEFWVKTLNKLWGNPKLYKKR